MRRCAHPLTFSSCRNAGSLTIAVYEIDPAQKSASETQSSTTVLDVLPTPEVNVQPARTQRRRFVTLKHGRPVRSTAKIASAPNVIAVR